MRFRLGPGVDLQLETDDPLAHAFYSSEFGPPIEAATSGARSLVLLWGRSAALGQPPVGFARRVHKVLARWDYRLSANGEFSIEAMGNRWALPMVHHMLVLPSLRRLSARRGLLMLHASAVAKQGSAVVFTGTGGAGKTTVSSLLLARPEGRWHPMSDDYVFLADGRRTHGFLTRSHLYSDVLRWVPTLSRRLSLGERLQLWTLGWIRRLSAERLKWPLRVSAGVLWPQQVACPEAETSAVLILRRANTDTVSLSRIAEGESARTSLLDMNFHEARHYVDLVGRSQFPGFDSGWVERWRAEEARLLAGRWQEGGMYHLELPRRPSAARELGEELERALLPLLELH